MKTIPELKKAITLEEWKVEGIRRFGPDQMTWRFVCPSCGHIASVQDYKDVGAEESAVAFSCIGRWLPSRSDAFSGQEGPCNYAGGGLFRISPVRIEGKGDERYFAFADAPEAIS